MKTLSDPPRLLDLTRAHWRPARLHEATLLIVDAQREYADGGLPLPGLDRAADEIAQLLAHARQSGAPVVHVVQHARQPDAAIFNPQGRFVEILPPLTPHPGETVIVKHLPNGFADTTLAPTLRAARRRQLIVVGFMTHMCVSATIRAALDHGYQCTVVAGACATRDLPDGGGGTIPAATVHRVELAALADRFAEVVSLATALRD